MTAKVGELIIGKGAAELLAPPSPQPLNPDPALVELGRFEEGQMSGPKGPKFVGFGAPVLRPLWRDLLENAAFGLGVGIAIFALQLAAHRFGTW